MPEFTTPMMKQYAKLKQEHGDCLLLFRLGDFYELFLDDAKIAAEVLDIALTSRDRGSDGRIPMAGVPYHALDSYLYKLVKAGYRVAIGEQVSEPDGKGIVDREVVRIVTPGTILDEKALERKENNYVVALHMTPKFLGIAVADISTADFQVSQFKLGNLEKILGNALSRYNPVECILSDSLYNTPRVLKILRTLGNLNIFPFDEWNFHADSAKKTLKDHFGVSNLSGFGLEDKPHAQKAAAGLLGYLDQTQKGKIKHINKVKTFTEADYLVLDRSTIFNLELLSTIRERLKIGSLIHLIDKTSTAMGGRLLRQWLLKPLINKKEINRRLDSVEFFLKEPFLREELKTHLEEMVDVERTLSRLSVGVGNARDLISLKNSLVKVKEVKSILMGQTTPLIRETSKNFGADLKKTVKLVEKNILDEPAYDVKQGGIIKDDIDSNLDKLRKKVLGSKDWILELEKSERRRTGIASLKVKFNKVFGYYIEISRPNLHLVPEDYIRKQTLVNAERFITPELKEHEEMILSAEEKINKIEYELFQKVLERVLENSEAIQKAAYGIAVLDCLLSFVYLAEREAYCRPEIVDSGETKIKDGRHPVVEKLLLENQFVPNDVVLNHKNQQLLIITGPNMAGKSVFIRQVAVIVLMAHMGSYVPADKAKISLVDRIFVRSGASDFITSGLSTFMVEMIETANILNYATDKSLIILDEIGRGTSTYDGVSIAWSVAEYLVENPKISSKTLFATHYHELQELEEKFKKVKNYQMAVENNVDDPVFLYKVVPGGASHSYGVAVAKLAGVPGEVTEKALEVLQNLDGTSKKPSYEENKLIKKLQKLDLDNMSPLNALNKLAELQEWVK